jgi:heptosyltransferase III
MTRVPAGQILAIHPGALGDVVQAVPALRALGAPDGAVHVAFAGQGRLARLLAGTGVVAEALDFDRLGLDALFTAEPPPAAMRARLTRFDRVVSWFGSRAEPFPAQLRAAARGVVLARPVPETGGPPVWRHLLETVAPVRSEEALVGPLHVPAAWGGEALAALSWSRAIRGRPRLFVHPGAGAAWKRWPAERFAEVVARVRRDTGCDVLVHQGPADAAAVTALEQAVGASLPRLVEPDLEVLAAGLAAADAYLGSDSGVSHLAAGVGAPALILFPPETRATWAPWSPTALALAAHAETGEVASLLGEMLTRRRIPSAELR